MDKDRFQFILLSMIVMIILLMLFSACRTRHYVTPAGVSVELPHTPQDAQKGGAR